MWAPLHLPCDTKQKADDLFFVFVAVLFVVVVFVVIVAIVFVVVVFVLAVFVLTVFIIVDFIAFIVVVVLHFSFHVILRIRSRMRIICFGPHIFDISLRLVVSNSLKKRGFSVL